MLLHQSLERSVSLKIIPTVTQGSDHIAEQDADDEEDQGQVTGDVHKSIAIGRPRRNPRKPSWLTTDMIVAYALPVSKRRSRLHIEKLKSVQSLRCGRMPWKKR